MRTRCLDTERRVADTRARAHFTSAFPFAASSSPPPVDSAQLGSGAVGGMARARPRLPRLERRLHSPSATALGSIRITQRLVQSEVFG
jgi:hypothetical protein